MFVVQDVTLNQDDNILFEKRRSFEMRYSFGMKCYCHEGAVYTPKTVKNERLILLRLLRSLAIPSYQRNQNEHGVPWY